MSQTSPPIGKTGLIVAANVEKLRRRRGLSLRKLSAELGRTGRPIFALGLSRMANGERRCDVDDLTALAEVLEVSPADLLLPDAAAPARDHPAVREAGNLTTRIEQLVEAADSSTSQALSGYVDRALRRVQLEVEELLAEIGKP